MAARLKKDRIRISRRGAYALNAKLAKLGTITLRELKRKAAKVRWDAVKERRAAERESLGITIELVS